MKKAICHYSFHRTLKDENWTLEDFVNACRDMEVDGIDFHQRFLPSPEEAPAAIKNALEGSGLELSGLSLSTDFNAEGDAFDEQIRNVKAWIKASGESGAKVSRVFGGHVKDRSDNDALKTAIERVTKAMEIITPVAEENNVVLALENHGGVPGTGEEQSGVINAINSPFLRATVDVGNYLSAGQDSAEGTAKAASLCSYVHFKDMQKTDEGLTSCIVGQGAVKHAECLKILSEAGFDGYVALEYEGSEDERLGVKESIAFMHEVMKNY
jgi:sugar phosphate isomerase/epimerase